MPDFIIKTHRKDVNYTSGHLFILNKGLNSGKPSRTPFANSFVILLLDDDEVDMMYWLAYSLWQAKFWHQHLIGSVIPFIRLPEFDKLFSPAVDRMLSDFEEHQKQVAALKLLLQKENQFLQNIALINDMRRIILHRYISK